MSRIEYQSQYCQEKSRRYKSQSANILFCEYLVLRITNFSTKGRICRVRGRGRGRVRVGKVSQSRSRVASSGLECFQFVNKRGRGVCFQE